MARGRCPPSDAGRKVPSFSCFLFVAKKCLDDLEPDAEKRASHWSYVSGLLPALHRANMRVTPCAGWRMTNAAAPPQPLSPGGIGKRAVTSRTYTYFGSIRFFFLSFFPVCAAQHHHCHRPLNVRGDLSYFDIYHGGP